MAFALLGARKGSYSREREDWPLGDGLYELASRAVSDDRNNRPQSVRELRESWRELENLL